MSPKSGDWGRPPEAPAADREAGEPRDEALVQDPWHPPFAGACSPCDPGEERVLVLGRGPDGQEQAAEVRMALTGGFLPLGPAAFVLADQARARITAVELDFCGGHDGERQPK